MSAKLKVSVLHSGRFQNRKTIFDAIQNQQMAGLSVVIITLNEERNIERCLKSVLAVADEIVVVDSLSEDRTKEICLAYNVRFIEHPFPGFIEQKNYALSRASHQHILSLDADEALSDRMIQYIISEKEKGFPFDAYGFNRLNNYCGQWIKHGTYYPDKKIRLIKAGTGSWGGENPHDKIIPEPGSKVHFEKVDILHFIYQHYADHLRQTDKFSSIAAISLFYNHRKPSWLKAIINPAWAFFYGFIVRRGFLDGWNGYMIARFTALHTFFKYSKLIELHKNSKQQAGKKAALRQSESAA